MSKTKECPACGLEVSRESKKCRYCGYEFPETSSGKMIAAYILVILLLLWLVFGVFY
jgi:uncharacterized protein (DUF983 family)